MKSSCERELCHLELRPAAELLLVPFRSLQCFVLRPEEDDIAMGGLNGYDSQCFRPPKNPSGRICMVVISKTVKQSQTVLDM